MILSINFLANRAALSLFRTRSERCLRSRRSTTKSFEELRRCQPVKGKLVVFVTEVFLIVQGILGPAVSKSLGIVVESAAFKGPKRLVEIRDVRIRVAPRERVKKHQYGKILLRRGGGGTPFVALTFS